MMKKLFAIAAFLLASTAAQAQYSFDYGGRTIRIDPDRGTVSIPGVYDNSGPRTKRSHSEQDSARPRKQKAPDQAKIDPPASAASPAPTENVPSAATSPEPSATTADGRFSRILPPPPSPNPRLSLRPLRCRRSSPRPQGFSRQTHRSACG
jgi:hypothetical protein